MTRRGTPTACNRQPPTEHPMYGTLTACHMAAGHEGPCTWSLEPSLARRGLDRLLAFLPINEVERVDAQPERALTSRDTQTNETSELTRFPAGPWVLVSFVGGLQFAIWKSTGAVYRVDVLGAVDDDPIITLDAP